MAQTKRKKTDYIIQSVDHALDVLEAFQGEEGELGITELSNRLKLHKNNIFRILATLESRGYVEQNPASDNYRLGLKTLELGQAYIRHTGLLRVARPVMERLRDELDENVYIGVLKGRYAYYLDCAESTRTVRVLSRVGCHVPPYCTALGKSQLAYEPAEQILSVLHKKELRRFTPKTMTDRDEVVRHLAQVREQGWAEDNEEWDEAVRCVAAPIFDYNRKVVGAISISAPSVRMTQERMEKEFLPRVRAAADEISTRLGYKVASSEEGAG